LAFVRTKTIDGGEYYQLVESRRIDGKPRQKVLVHLGRHPTVDEALKEWPKEARHLRRVAAKERKTAESLGEGATDTGLYRDSMRRADSADKRADALEANLEKLKELRNQGRA